MIVVLCEPLLFLVVFEDDWSESASLHVVHPICDFVDFNQEASYKVRSKAEFFRGFGNILIVRYNTDVILIVEAHFEGWDLLAELLIVSIILRRLNNVVAGLTTCLNDIKRRSWLT